MAPTNSLAISADTSSKPRAAKRSSQQTAHQQRVRWARWAFALTVGLGALACWQLGLVGWDAARDAGTGPASGSVSTVVAIVLVTALLLALIYLLLKEMKRNGQCLELCLGLDALSLRPLPYTQARKMVGDLREAAALPESSLFREQVEALERIFNNHPSYSDAFARALSDMPRVPGRPRTLRSLEQFLVNLLLAIGIIGTFYGLILFLSDPVFLAVLRTQALGEDMTSIAASFQVAFGTSLLAYWANAAGRFLLDLADEDEDATWSAYQDLLLLPLLHAFPVRGTVGKVEWDSRSLGPLEEIAAALKKSAAETMALRGAIDRVGNQLQAQAETLARQTNDAAAVLTRIDKAGVELTATLAATTEKMATTLSETSEKMLTRVAAASEKMTANLAAATEKVTAGADQFAQGAVGIQAAVNTLATNLVAARTTLDSSIGALQGTSAEMGKVLAEVVGKAGQALNASLTTATGRFDQVATDLGDMLGKSQESIGALTTTISEIERATSRLELATRQVGTEVSGAVRGVGASVAASLQADAALRDALSRQLEEQLEALQQVGYALDGLRQLIHDALDREQAVA